MTTALTWLYVPADRPDRIGRAFASSADVVIIDLEDAVAPARKDEARAQARQWLAPGADGRAVQVRINAHGTPWAAADREMLRGLPTRVGVRLPKCADPAQVRAVADVVPGHALHLLIESALGVERALDLATCAPSVASVGLGEADLRAELNVTSEEGLSYARSRLVSAAAAAGLPPPAMSVFANIRDLDGLQTSCVTGRGLGFVGRAAIHPDQLDIIRAEFTPSDDEVRSAQELLAAASTEHGATATPDGRFVDEAVLRAARRVLDLAGLR